MQVNIYEIAVNAFVWTGIVALAVTVFQSDYSLLAFFALIAAINILVHVAFTTLFGQPMHNSHQADGGTVGFRLTPLRYPKVLDSEIRDYVSEFIRLDIQRDGALVFSGNLAREAIKNLREAVDGALSAKELQFSPAPATAAKRGK